MNAHAAWRMAVAERAAGEYARNGKLAAMTVAGSVGAGLADRFSDLELDCYWSSAPDDRDRTGPVDALGGELTALWDYDDDDEEWSEDYRLGELEVTVSNFLTTSIERCVPQAAAAGEQQPAVLDGVCPFAAGAFPAIALPVVPLPVVPLPSMVPSLPRCRPLRPISSRSKDGVATYVGS